MAGCAQPPITRSPVDANTQVWRGRLALQIDSDPPQSFSAGFELSGHPRSGELLLLSPLGNTVAHLNWSPQSATLRNNGELRQFDSLDALAEQATGTAIPISALFQWLAGQEASAAGWLADLSQLGQGRLVARRTQPAPAAELRLILEP